MRLISFLNLKLQERNATRLSLIGKINAEQISTLPNESNEPNEPNESLQCNPDDTNLSDTETETVTDSVIGTETETVTVIEHDNGTGAAIAALIGSSSTSFNPLTTADIKPLLKIDSLSEDVFKGADINKDHVTDIVEYFCRKYRDVLGKSCPSITDDFAKTIPTKIVNLIDQATGEYLFDSSKWNHDPDRCTQWYKDMIDMYFDTEFKDGCNYSLQHFFSGNIRVLRYHEVGRLPYEF